MAAIHKLWTCLAIMPQTSNRLAQGEQLVDVSQKQCCVTAAILNDLPYTQGKLCEWSQNLFILKSKHSLKINSFNKGGEKRTIQDLTCLVQILSINRLFIHFLWCCQKFREGEVFLHLAKKTDLCLLHLVQKQPNGSCGVEYRLPRGRAMGSSEVHLLMYTQKSHLFFQHTYMIYTQRDTPKDYPTF